MFNTLPKTFERNQWLIDLMAAPALEEAFEPADTLDELMAQYENCHVEPIGDKIMRLERFLLTLPQVDMPVKHYIVNGLYYRELFIPAGTALTGEVHLDAHLCIMLKGDITILSKDGLARYSEPCTFQSDGMIKRAGYAHSDTVFINIHRTDETCPERAAAKCVFKEGE